MKNKFLSDPVIPFEILPEDSVGNSISRMKDISFQARNLGTALEIWKNMLKEETTICLGLAGAMIPAGLRRVMTYLIDNRYIDCLVSTGANLFHNFHEALGRKHYKGSPLADDDELFSHHVDRIYDVFADENEFQDEDKWIGRFTTELDQERPYTTREFLFRLGEKLAETSPEHDILQAAFKQNLPIYCPAIADSSIGIGIAVERAKGNTRFQFDVIKDVIETSCLVGHSKQMGVIYIGGGTPKNFIQQTAVTHAILTNQYRGHKFAIQIITDSPHWGGLSGCTFDEAKSWGKIMREARMVTVHSDATIAFTMLVQALAEAGIKREKFPRFKLDGPDLEFSKV